MTKQFTSVAVLQLMEAGKVQLDEPIQTYLPYFTTKEHTITIHHLLSQTSGIPEFFDVDEDEFAILHQKHTPQELIDCFQDRPLQFEPGSSFSYSNSNYPLLGAIIEVVSGMSLADYLDEHIFGPLNMNNTSFKGSEPLSQRE
jgi:CubicO group peptidase (beta-lactamase class C family)